MIIETGKIERGDRVYASMIKSGKVLAELRCDTTVSGMTDVYKALCRFADGQRICQSERKQPHTRLVENIVAACRQGNAVGKP